MFILQSACIITMCLQEVREGFPFLKSAPCIIRVDTSLLHDKQWPHALFTNSDLLEMFLQKFLFPLFALSIFLGLTICLKSQESTWEVKKKGTVTRLWLLLTPAQLEHRQVEVKFNPAVCVMRLTSSDFLTLQAATLSLNTQQIATNRIKRATAK